MLPDRLRRLDAIAIPGLCAHAHLATSARARLLGLALLDAIPPGRGLLIPRCRAIHTFGMRFPLDVYFLDARLRVVDVCPALPPGRLAACRDARAVLELPATPAARERPDIGVERDRSDAAVRPPRRPARPDESRAPRAPAPRSR